MDEKLLETIRGTYNLSEINSVAKIEKGFLSENYKISTEDQSYFLKKYRFTDENRIREIHSVKSYFGEGGVPVILPMRSQNGGTYFEYTGSYFALFPFVSGLQPERGTLSRDMIVSLGKALGKMHLLGKESDLKADNFFKVWNKEKALEEANQIEEKLEKIDNKTDFDLLAQEVVAFKKDLIRKNDISFKDLELKNNHLIHGDYLDQNVFFNEEEDVKYIFDFEKTSYKPRTHELFRSATYSFLNTDFDDTSIRNIRLYLNSYLDVYPMEREEFRNGLIAHYVESMHGFWVEKEHYLHSNTRVDLFLELNYKRLKFMSERLNDLL